MKCCWNTRRVKAAGDHWVVEEKKGRKVYSQVVFAPADTIDPIRAELNAERSTESFAKKKEADTRRRFQAQAEYVEDCHTCFSLFKKGYSMTQSAISCPKCQGEMVQGYVLDFTPVGVRVRKWNSGPPKNASWVGILDAPSQIPIGTFRCQSCGFLESYAREEFAAK